MIKELWQNRRIIYRLSIIELKSSFKASILSYFWIFISPALMVGMYLFSFYAFQGNNSLYIDLPHYHASDFLFLSNPEPLKNVSKIGWLIVGVLTWTYAGSILTQGSYSVKQYSWLVTKIGTPLSVPPMMVNLSKAYVGIGTIIVSWILYMIIAACNHDPNLPIVDIHILQFPIMITLLFLFLSLWSIVIAPITSISKDALNFIFLIPMVLQWVTGVFLPLASDQMSSAVGIIFRLNPFNFLVSGIRMSIMGSGYFWSDAISLISFASFFALFFGLAVFITKRSKRVVVDLL